MGYVEDAYTELTRLETARNNAYLAVSDMGGTLPQTQNYDNLPDAILSIVGSMASFTVLAEQGLTINAINGNKVRLLTWNGTAYYASDIDEYGEWTVKIEGEEETPQADISGAGNGNYCYVSINGTKYVSSGIHNIHAGDSIIFGIGSKAGTGSVVIDGITVKSVTGSGTSWKTSSYTYVVPDNTSLKITLYYSANQLGSVSVTTKLLAPTVVEVNEATNYNVDLRQR